MDSEVLVAVLGAVVAIVTASLSYYFTKKKEFDDNLRQRKQKRYDALLGAISDWGDLNMSREEELKARRQMATTINDVALVAPPSLIGAVMHYWNVAIYQGWEEQTESLNKLVVEMRRNLELPESGDPATLGFSLVCVPKLDQDDEGVAPS